MVVYRKQCACILCFGKTLIDSVMYCMSLVNSLMYTIMLISTHYTSFENSSIEVLHHIQLV